ncbi:MAG: cytochrome-c peroxidase [Planctomycetota bacterium]|jgi:cytochrome c peroxidase
MRAFAQFSALCTALALAGCSSGDDAKKGDDAKAEKKDDAKKKDDGTPDAKDLSERAKRDFGILPEVAESPDNPVTEEKVALGRMLYYDARLSKNHDVACESCHHLADFGVDGAKTSTGHKEQKGGRNAPTVYNAGFHVAQFWDGRAANVEEQAKGPILNPIEMAIPDEAAALAVLNSIPGYVEAFEKAFPGEGVTYDNVGKAIGAFERKLVTPGPFDKFMAGDTAALDAKALAGLQLFYDAGCISCHAGPAVGGGIFQKLGNIKPYDTLDEGRFEHTKNEADKFIFKVPSLRNIAKTGPYLHDGSIGELRTMVKIMVEHQTAKGSFTDPELDSVLAFLDALTGEIDADYIKKPELPESGPNTPKPDPS